MLQLVHDHISAGSRELVDIMKKLVAEADPPLWEMLDKEKDHIFREPLLFAYFSTPLPEISLRALLWGYIDKLRRPARVQLHVPANGIILLPAFGYLKTSLSNVAVQLVYDHQSDLISLEYENNLVSFRFEPLVKINGTSVELVKHPVSLLNCCFEVEADVDITEMAETYHSHLEQAFEYLQLMYPQFYSLLTTFVQKIVVFRSSNHNSFAAIKGHGIAFINVTEPSSPAFFVEDLLHQGGHNIFSTLTFNKSTHLAVHPDSLMPAANASHDEHRTVYVFFHGLFTEALMNECMDICMDDPRVPEVLRNEFKARTGFILLKFCLDIQHLDNKDFFTPAGWEIYEAIKTILYKVYAKRRQLLHELNYTNQPYTFSYERFLELNEICGTKTPAL